MNEGALLELEEQFFGVAVLWRIGGGRWPRPAGELVFEFDGGHREAVEAEHQIEAVVVLEAVP